MTKYDKDALDWEYVDRVLGVERCSWCDEPATIARGTADARCAAHDALWFGEPAWSADPVSVLVDGSRVVCLKLPRRDATPTTCYQTADALAHRIIPGARLYATGDSDGTVRRLYHG